MTDRVRRGLLFGILVAAALTHGTLSAREAGWLGTPATVVWPGRFLVRGVEVDGYTHLQPVATWLQHELPRELPVTALAEQRAPHHWLRYLTYPRSVDYASFASLSRQLDRGPGVAHAFVVLPPATPTPTGDPFLATRKVERALRQAWPHATITELFRGETGVTVLLAARR